MRDAAIATEALTRRYRSHAALNEVTLRVPAGSVYALVGRTARARRRHNNQGNALKPR
jgi:ABC-type sugar transport system ATPase subunit